MIFYRVKLLTWKLLKLFSLRYFFLQNLYNNFYASFYFIYKYNFNYEIQFNTLYMSGNREACHESFVFLSYLAVKREKNKIFKQSSWIGPNILTFRNLHLKHNCLQSDPVLPNSSQVTFENRVFHTMRESESRTHWCRFSWMVSPL